MPANLETQQWPQDWKSSVFIPIPKKGNAKECSSYHTIALISHASKVMLQILQARLEQYVNQELPDVQAGFRKAGFMPLFWPNIFLVAFLEKAVCNRVSREKPEIKLPTSTGSSKKQENSRKTSTSASLTRLKPLTVWITANRGKF